MGRKLSNFLRIGPNDGPLIVQLFLLSFCTGLVKVFLFTSANAMFISHAGADRLPLVYLAAAVASPLVGAITLGLQRGVKHESALLASLLLLIGVTVGFRLFVGQFPGDAVYLGLLVWYYIVNAMIAVLFWSLAAWTIDVRESKHVHGLIGSGTLIAGFCGGIAIRPLLTVTKVENILWLSAGALAACLWLTYRICVTHKLRNPAPISSKAEADNSGGGVRGFVAVDLLLVGLVASSYCFVDRVFLSQAELRFPQKDELAVFLGEFSAAVEFASFVLQLFFTGRIFNRLGLGATLSLMPLALLAFSLVVLVTLVAGGSDASLLWLFCGMKFCDLVFRKSINLSALQLLIQPLTLRTRERLRTWGQMIVMPIARGLASFAMLGFVSVGWGGTTPLTAMIAAIAIVWAISSRYAARQYNVHLERALSNGAASAGTTQATLPGDEPITFQSERVKE